VYVANRNRDVRQTQVPRCRYRRCRSPERSSDRAARSP
jgi:hypothetical protein